MTDDKKAKIRAGCKPTTCPSCALSPENVNPEKGERPVRDRRGKSPPSSPRHRQPPLPHAEFDPVVCRRCWRTEGGES